ncbi:MAG: hypothetical protein IPJ41_12135 [Phycisphaerales bacterium]|nr:hypothetical protein [Phycisphaerales bacterium]
MRCNVSFVIVSALLAVTAPVVRGQGCQPRWDVTIGNPGVSSSVGGLMLHDLGAGERLLVCGLFLEPSIGKAAWDGAAWSPVGEEFAGGIVTDFAVFDDGSGPKLHISGNFWVGGTELYHVARLDGDSWTFLDIGRTTDTVAEMAVWDDGTGPGLFVTGDFDSLDGVTAHNSIAKWDGRQWHPLKAGLNVGSTQIGLALQVFDDGSGEKLYLGGQFQKVDSKPIRYLARWDGAAWTGVGGGLDDSVQDLCVYDDGAGRALYAAGYFRNAEGRLVNHVAKWGGFQWSGLDGGTLPGEYGAILGCGVFDDGSGPALFVSGWIQSAGGIPMCNMAKWNGVEWSNPGGGLDCQGTAGAFALLGLPPTSPFGPSLFAGGAFHFAGGQPTNFIAEYRGCFCLPDWNGDGTVNTQDFIAYLNDWAARAPRADLNGDGVVNTLDFLAFLNAWATGC